MPADPADLQLCGHCYAYVRRSQITKHYKWHAKVEPDLERPTSDFGFWSKGRWNPTSKNW